MGNVISKMELSSTTPPEEQPNPSPKKSKTEGAELFGFRDSRFNFAEPLSQDSIPINPADLSYSSDPFFSADDSKKIVGFPFCQSCYFADHFNTTGRNDQEQFPHDPQPVYFSGYSGLEEDHQQPPAFLAPEPRRFRNSRKTTELWLREIYEDNRLVDPVVIPSEAVKRSIELILPLIYENHKANEPIRPDVSIGASDVKLLIFMRRDQYVKKAWSKVKIMVCKRQERPKILEPVAGDQLGQGQPEIKDIFDNVFGKGPCDCLKMKTIEYIIRNYTLFRMIFNLEFFYNLREELNKETLQDIKDLLLKKLYRYLAGLKGGWEEAEAHFRADLLVKTPFTFLQNNASLIFLVNQFFKQLHKMEMNGADKARKKKTLTSLRKKLIKYANTRNWTLISRNFWKSEIFSQLRR